jgi:hypothetical protein
MDLRIEAVMTRRKQPWGQQRGWIVPADGSPPQELPQQMVGHKLISWPGTMPERQPAEPVKDLAAKDYYHRHVLNPEGVSVYVPEGRSGIPARVHQERNPAPGEGTVVGALDLLRSFIAPSLAAARPRFSLGDGNYHSRGPNFASKSDQRASKGACSGV